jgi:FtsP/CotA-like multicopper oxidase with cupredoxin domain
MSKDTIETGARRRFLRTLGVAGAAAALPLAAATPAAARTPRENREEMRRRRYQPDSPHVQAFYRTNRYER